jgi:hypothetical protein
MFDYKIDERNSVLGIIYLIVNSNRLTTNHRRQFVTSYYEV